MGAVLVLFTVGLALWGSHGSETLQLWGAPEGWTATQVHAVLVEWGVPVYLVGALILFATCGGGVPLVLAAIYPSITYVAELLHGLAWFMLFPLAYVFPDGRFVPRWTRGLLGAWAALFVVISLAPGTSDDLGLALGGALLVLLGSGVAAQIYRYLRVSGRIQRQQTKWVAFAIAMRFVYMVLLIATPLAGLDDEISLRGLVSYMIVMLVSYAIAALLPIAVALAVVRYRLFDVDLLISRTVVYGVLTGFLVATYAAIVVGVGALWQGAGNALLPLLATGLVAVAFNPLRVRVQRRINRWLYGQRDDPYQVLTQPGRRLGATLPAESVLQTVVDTIGQTMKYPYVAISTYGDLPCAATYGSLPDTVGLTRFRLRFHGEPLGTLEVASRPGEQLRDGDKALLDEVARQAGIAVRAARLTGDLQRSRERLVVTREDERRRLRRDLHDGLGPTLASLYQRIDRARALLARDPQAAERLLAETQEHAKTTIGDIRQLVYSLRPPALDELGLVPALEDGCRRLNGHPEQLTIQIQSAALPELPALVEVAAYRIAIEAVTNTIKHAQARHCTIRLATLDSGNHSTHLTVDITDDGIGVAIPMYAGVGSSAMRERAEEIGGTLAVVADSPRGTAVRAELPLTVDTDTQP